jgi:hypothetical protein
MAIENMEYNRYRKRMGGGKFDDDLAKRMEVRCNCNKQRIPGLDFIII